MMSQLPFGFLLIDKPVGWTSFDVCGKLRKILKIKKIGHTGTLDPFATGLLIVAVGKATKLIPFLEKDQKIYETEILLGHTSETLDTESKIKKISDNEISKEAIEQILCSNFLGKIQQIPPKYSALKINDKKMCDMARKGEDFEIKARETEIISTKILDFNFPVVKIRLEVSAGFYVRSFARDLGVSLGLGGGVCQQLRRIGIGDICPFCHFEVDKNTVEKKYFCSKKVKNDIESITVDDLISPEKILKLQKVEIPKDRISDFLQGRAFKFDNDLDDKFMVMSEDRFLGIGEMKYKNLQPRLGFIQKHKKKN